MEKMQGKVGFAKVEQSQSMLTGAKVARVGVEQDRSMLTGAKVARVGVEQDRSMLTGAKVARVGAEQDRSMLTGVQIARVGAEQDKGVLKGVQLERVGLMQAEEMPVRTFGEQRIGEGRDFSSRVQLDTSVIAAISRNAVRKSQIGMQELTGNSRGISKGYSKDYHVNNRTAPSRGAEYKVDVNGEPVTYGNLIVLNLPALSIESFLITNKVNEHARLELSGTLEGDGSRIVTDTMVGSPIYVSYYKENKSLKPFFVGVITNVKVYNKESNQVVELVALSNTSTLDTMKKSQSCQKTETTYQALMEQVASRCNATTFYGLSADSLQEPLGKISIQYKETDWEYLKRLASHKNLGLYADMTMEMPVFSVGALGNVSDDVKVLTYEYSKNIRDYEVESANYKNGIYEEDYLVYTIETYRILKLGDMVEWEGKRLYIREARYEMVNAMVLATYVLSTENGLKQRRISHEKLQGLSINGTAAGVVRDKVKIQLEIDKESNAEYLFPYSTMSASPDGSGWYCMPQDGDLLRVYFPDDDEANCFAISSVSSYTPESGAVNDKMADPGVTYLSTPDNMEIKMEESGIVISANEGTSVIMMDNQGNVTISGANSIRMTATNDINIMAANNISLYATQEMKLSGQSGSITMGTDGKTKLTGGYVLEN